MVTEILKSFFFMSESSLHCQTSYKGQKVKMAAPMHVMTACFAQEQWLKCSFFSNLDGRNSRSQKNNYNFDKMTVVEIQEGSKY